MSEYRQALRTADEQLLWPAQRKRLFQRLPLGVRIISWVLLVAVAYAIVSGYLTRLRCEHRGGIYSYSAGVQTCQRVPQ